MIGLCSDSTVPTLVWEVKVIDWKVNSLRRTALLDELVKKVEKRMDDEYRREDSTTSVKVVVRACSSVPPVHYSHVEGLVLGELMDRKLARIPKRAGFAGRLGPKKRIEPQPHFLDLLEEKHDHNHEEVRRA